MGIAYLKQCVNVITNSKKHITIITANTLTFKPMSEAELKKLSIKDLLAIADKAMDLYVSASVDPEHRLVAQQRQADLFILNKVITEKKANELF